MEVVVPEAETDVDGTRDDAEEEARDAVVLGERFVFSTVICERKVAVNCCGDDVRIVTSSLKRLKCDERSNLSTTKNEKNILEMKTFCKAYTTSTVYAQNNNNNN